MKTQSEAKLYCNRCGHYTDHDIIAHESQKFTPENTPDMQIEFAEGTWEMLKCRGCGEITFREMWVTSEDYNPITGECEPKIQLYPPRSENLLQTKLYYSVPANLKRIYQEIVDCYNRKNYTLCAAGLRAIIEGICVANNIKEGPVEVRGKDGTTKVIRKSNLEGKIEGIAKAGFITETHAKTLHELRFLGNNAIHELQRPSPEELKLAIEIIEHTLDNVYEVLNKAERLRRKRVHRK